MTKNDDKTMWRRVILLLALSMQAPVTLGDNHQGNPLLPRFKNIQMKAWVIPAGNGYLRYSYSVQNPRQNTSSVREISIDITSEFGKPNLQSSKLTIPAGNKKVSLKQYRKRFSNGSFDTIVPVGMEAPPQWRTNLTINDGGYAVFSTGNRGDKSRARIRPGKSQGELFLISQGLPTIRDVEVIPSWTHKAMNAGELSAIELLETEELEAQAIYYTWTLGPSGIEPGSSFHMDLIYSGIYRSIEIGWIKNKAWGNKLAREISAAKYAFEEGKKGAAKLSIIKLLNMVQRSETKQRANEFYTLMYWNLGRFLEKM